MDNFHEYVGVTSRQCVFEKIAGLKCQARRGQARCFLHHMRQIEQKALTIGGCCEYRAEQMAASAGDIADNSKSGEITTLDDRGDLPLRFGQHRRVEDAICFWVLPEVTPEPFGESPLHRPAAGPDGIFQLTISVPIDRQPKHAYKGAHRLRVIAA